MTQKEIWKDIPTFEGYYQASNLGRVRSLDRVVLDSIGRKKFIKSTIIKGSLSRGYRQTILSVNCVRRNFKFSQLIAMAFLNHRPNGHKLVVDHINGNKSDDRLINLRIVTARARANTSTCFRSNENSFSSKFIGVRLHKRDSKWYSRIKFNGKLIFLGSFACELEASNAYQLALSKIKDGTFSPDDYKPKYKSKYRGVSFNKRDENWFAQIRVKGCNKYLGSFNSELEAHHAYQNALKEYNL